MKLSFLIYFGGRRDRMIVGFITTCPSYDSWIYNYLSSQYLSPLKYVSSNPVHDEVYSIQHCVIKFVSHLQQVSGFLRVLWFPPLIKLTTMI